MSFLKKKRGPSQAELLKENKIKKLLTNEFAKALKDLQQKYLNNNEPVYSNDSANHLCNVLEAVFLHGLKDSVTAKIASYVNFSHDHVSQVNTNFWNFVVMFTHKDVISQLKHLGQITTETGLSRAWIRLGLNDGLMESYLESITSDRKTLDYYYHPVSYLRDIEQPGILKSYMKGLMELNFKLSFNSSVLNNWTITPLNLSGIIERSSTPTAIGDTKPTEYRQSLEDSKKNSKKDSPVLVRSRSRTKSRGNSDSEMPNSSVPNVPPNTPFSSSGFTRQDVEDIKKLMVASNYSVSECSSSNISCPDPDDTDEQPHHSLFMEHDLDFEEMPANSAQPTKSRGKKSRKKPYKSSIHHSTPDKPKAKPFEHLPSQDETSEQTFQNTNKIADIEADVLLDTNEQPMQQSKQRPRTRLEDLPPFESLHCHTREKSPPIAPILSTATVETIDTVGKPPVALVNEELHKHSTSGRTSIDKLNVSNSPRSFGNNLNFLDGWSSPMEHYDEHGDLARERASSTNQEIPRRNKAESFGTLLQNYTPSSLATSASMNDVLQNLDERDTSDCRPVSSTNVITSSELCEYGLDGYEIIPEPSLSFQDAAVINVKKQQMTEIATEKGLDAQNYQCNDCKRPIGLFYGKPRVCTFDGGYYCFECHENEEYYIPALIVHNWDFRKQQVSRNNLKFLMEYEEEALLDISEINSKLYDHVSEMEELKQLRTQLFYLRTYLFTCKQSVAEELRRRVWPREFLYDNIHIYSLGDFFHVYSGQLARSLKEINKFAMSHVYDCMLCSQKGFICEVCSSKKVIYPFETETTHRCSMCNAVFHKSCMSEKLPCPRCQRWRRRQSKTSESLADIEDYANSPEL